MLVANSFQTRAWAAVMPLCRWERDWPAPNGSCPGLKFEFCGSAKKRGARVEEGGPSVSTSLPLPGHDAEDATRAGAAQAAGVVRGTAGWPRPLLGVRHAFDDGERLG